MKTIERDDFTKINLNNDWNLETQDGPLPTVQKGEFQGRSYKVYAQNVHHKEFSWRLKKGVLAFLAILFSGGLLYFSKPVRKLKEQAKTGNETRRIKVLTPEKVASNKTALQTKEVIKKKETLETSISRNEGKKQNQSSALCSQELSFVSECEKRAASFEEAQKRNPYLFVNRTEIHLSTNIYKAFDEVNYFQKAIESANIAQVKEFLDNPHFIGINDLYDVEDRDDHGTTRYYLPSLILALRSNNFELFSLLLSDKRIDIDIVLKSKYNTALEVACSMGVDGEPYIRALIAKQVSPAPKALELAKENGVGDDCFNELETYIKAHEIDDRGDSKLHRAIQKGDLLAFQKAIQSKISLNVHNNDYLNTPLHEAIKLLKKDKSTAIEMITQLIRAGADVDAVSENKLTPLFMVCYEKPSGWEEAAILLLSAGADFQKKTTNGISPIDYLYNESPTHPVKEWILKNSNGQLETMQNQRNLATLFGLHFDNSSGGNYAAPIFEMLKESFNEFLSKNHELEERCKTLKSSVDLAQFLASTNDVDEALNKVKDALDKNIPVIIPSGWEGHATAIVLHGKRAILCNKGEPYLSNNKPIDSGLVVFDNIDFNKCLNSSFFVTMLKREENKVMVTRSDYLLKFKRLVEGSSYDHIPLNNQKHGNCTWSSGASLGLRAAWAAIESVDEPYLLKKELGLLMKQFSQFTQLWAVEKYVSDVLEHVESSPLRANFNLLTFLLNKLCKKIDAKKDPYGYYAKALDRIVKSGIPLTSYLIDRSSFDTLSRIYNISPEELERFKEALAPNDCAIGKWKYPISSNSSF